MNSLEFILCYLGIINVISFLAMGSDKRKAKRNAFRTPESILFIFALMGGSIGSILGMYIFRHKTKHWYFVVGMPLILLIQIGIVVAIKMSPVEVLFR
ncbi:MULTISPECIES: DUF1294 domain-containing protein [unclassified Butyrivibrio]|jgi:uncharacterized membrane protein YsdA (DUF1294 family)|uniref:DUF1294 domain-containing protein n=1 Tax=unclassified Butyrivibrio TaxID=2639466 RepID=UPI0003F6EF05|nr:MULTISPECIES: DUF1294 domain-containing protein [unclassified Butyrivibrio]MCR5343774.1 DUF1294 domain-containing protein [Butyrivibrio sp.]